MKRLMTVASLMLLTAFVHAHFVFVVPGKDQTVKVVFSDSLEADEAVTVDKITGIKLRARDSKGTETVLECKAGKHELTAMLAPDTQLLYGSVQYGLSTRGESSYLLVYHPKYIGPKADPKLTKLTNVVIEIVPETREAKTKFLVLVQGKPAPDTEVTVMLPDETKAKVKTDKDGYTQAYEAKGRYGAWAKTTTTEKSGEIDGKKYSETRHYATLVVDLP